MESSVISTARLDVSQNSIYLYHMIDNEFGMNPDYIRNRFQSHFELV